MEKTTTNAIAHKIIKRPPSSGIISIMTMESEEDFDKKLLLFAEIETSDKDNETIINSLRGELEHQFFNTPAQQDEYAFENALAKSNIKIKDILLSKPKNWLNKIHIAAVALCKDEIHIAPVGNAHAFLVHNQKITDVLKNPQAAPTPNPVKLFTNIVSGKLGIGNAVVLANESVLDYMSEERIRKSAHEYGPDEAIGRLSEILYRAPENKQFGLIIIKRQYRTAEQEVPQAHDVPDQTRIETFDSSRSQTQELIKKFKPYLQYALSFILALLLRMLEKLQRFFASIIPLAARAGMLAATLLKNQSARYYHLHKIKQWARNIRPGKQSAIGLAIFLLAAVFALSISFKAKNNAFKANQANVQEKMRQIEKKIAEAEAALIYDNKRGAITLISESESLLNGLYSEDSGQKDEYRQMRDKIENLKNRSEKRRILDNLSPFAHIIPEPISAKETGLLQSGDDLLFFDGTHSRIAKIDLERGLLLNLPLENQGMESFNTALAISGNLIAALRTGTVLIINTEDETVSKQKLLFDPISAKPFASYGKNLYTFDVENNKILRYRNAGPSFTAAQNWLNQEYELSTMADIEVDGFVYLIDTQGNIHTFLKSRFRSRIPWPLGDTPKDNIRLYTNENIENFYVLDSGNKRIVRIAKNGDFLGQIVSEIFSNGSDLAADKNEQNLYVLAYDKIYKIPITE